MPAGTTHAERVLWLRWIIATTVGSILGGAGTGAMVGGALLVWLLRRPVPASEGRM